MNPHSRCSSCRSFHHDTKGTPSSSAKGEKEVGILAVVGGQVLPIGCYDLDLELKHPPVVRFYSGYQGRTNEDSRLDRLQDQGSLRALRVLLLALRRQGRFQNTHQCRSGRRLTPSSRGTNSHRTSSQNCDIVGLCELVQFQEGGPGSISNSIVGLGRRGTSGADECGLVRDSDEVVRPDSE